VEYVGYEQSVDAVIFLPLFMTRIRTYASLFHSHYNYNYILLRLFWIIFHCCTMLTCICAPFRFLCFWN
jgi:hypothetical protein